MEPISFGGKSEIHAKVNNLLIPISVYNVSEAVIISLYTIF